MRLTVWCLGLAAMTAATAEEILPEYEDPAGPCTVEDTTNCLDGIAIGAVSPDGMRRISAVNSRMVDDRVEDQMAIVRAGPVRPSGLPAGDTGPAVSVWGNFSHTAFASDFVIEPASSSLTAHDSRVNAGMVGADVVIGERFVVGTAFGYEDSHSDTPFNGGNHEANGFSVTPYAAVLLTDYLSVDVSGGIAWLDNDQVRIDREGAVPMRAGFDSRRRFVAANIATFRGFGDFTLGATAGILHAKQTEDGYTEQGPALHARTITEREVKLTQALIGADASYRFGGAEMFGFANYRNDLSRDEGRGVGGLPSTTGPVQPDDEDELELGVGARFLGEGPLSGSVELSHIMGRENFDSWTGAVTLRVDL